MCPVGESVGGCGARAVSRKTPIYFIILFQAKFDVQARATEYSWLFVTFSAAGFWDKLTKHASTTWHTGAADNQNIPVEAAHTISFPKYSSQNIPQRLPTKATYKNILAKIAKL